MKHTKYSFLIFFYFFFIQVHSQELNCNITVNTSKLPGTNKQVFITLQKSLSDFMNNTTWTNNVFELNERIECNFLFNITDETGPGAYMGTLNIQARRPVYSSSYNTVMFSVKRLMSLICSEVSAVPEEETTLSIPAFIVTPFLDTTL